jgi:hypothetical protein
MSKDHLLIHNIGDLVMSRDKDNKIILGYIIGSFLGQTGTYYEVEWIHGNGYMYYGYYDVIKMKGELSKFKEENRSDKT